MKLRKEIFWKRWKTWLLVGLALISLVGLSSSWFLSEVQAEERIGGGIPSTVPPTFDWNLLNSDGLNLKDYTEVKENTPVPITGGAFNSVDRQYMFFFGDMKESSKWQYTTNSFQKVPGAAVYAPLNAATNYPYLPIQGAGVTGYPKASGVGYPFAYSYNYSRYEKPQPAFGDSAQGFDVGIVKNGQVHGMMAPRDARAGLTNFIIKQYIRNNEIISYGFLQMSPEAVSAGAPNFLPIRVHGYVVNLSTGRLRYDVTVYNSTDAPITILPMYGIHVDIMGEHLASKLYSSGGDGVYFNQPSNKKDRIPTRLYFYKGDDYPDNNGPKYYQTGNLNNDYANAWNIIAKHFQVSTFDAFKDTNPYGKGQEAQSAGYAFDLWHPMFNYRWDPIDIKSKQAATFAFDLSIEEPGPVAPIVSKSFKNLTATDKKNHVGDTLEFSLSLGNHGENSAWEGVTVKDVLPEHLKVDSSSFKLERPNGTETSLPASIYNAANRTLTAGPYTVQINENYQIKFKAEITGNGGETIVNKMAASDRAGQTGEVTSEVEIPVEKVPKANLVVKFMNGKTQLNAPITINDVVGKKINLSTNGSVKPILDKLLKDYNFVSKPDDTAVPIKDGGSEFVYQFTPKEGTLNVYFKDSSGNNLNPETGGATSAVKSIAIKGKINKTIDLKTQPAIISALKVMDQYFELDLDKTPNQSVELTQPSQDFTYVFNRVKAPWTIRFLEDGTNKKLRNDLVFSKETGWNWNVDKDTSIQNAVKAITDQYYKMVRTEGIKSVQLTKQGATFTYYFQANDGTLNVRFKDTNGKILDPATGGVNSSTKPIPVVGKIHSTINLQKQPSISAALGVMDQYFDLDTSTPNQNVLLTQPTQDFTYVFKRVKVPWTIKFVEEGTNKKVRDDIVLSKETGWNWNIDNEESVKNAVKAVTDQYYQMVRTEGDKVVQLTKKGATLTYYFQADEGTVNVYFKDSAGKDINPATGAVISSPKSIAIKGKIHDTIDLPKQSSIASALKVLDQYFDIDLDKTPNQKVTLTQPSQDFTYVLNRAKAPWTIRFLEDGTNKKIRDDLVFTKSTGWNWNVDKEEGIQAALKTITDQYYQLVRTEGIKSVQLTKEGATFTYYFKVEEGTLNVYFKDSANNDINPATGAVTKTPQPIEIKGKIHDTIDLQKQSSTASALKVLDQYFDIDLDKTPDQKVELTQPSQDFTYVLNRVKAPWTIRFLEDGTNKELRDDLVFSKDTGWNWPVDKNTTIQNAVKSMTDQYYKLVRTEGNKSVQLTKEGATFTYYFQAELGTVKVRFQNSKGEELGDPIELTGRISSTISLTDDNAVKAKLDELAKQGYTTAQNPKVKIEETETEYIFVLSEGDFSLKSAPEMLEFHDYETGVYGKVTAANPDWGNQPLVVTDMRAHPEGWEVKVQMTQDLTSQEDNDFSLKNVLYYKRDNAKTSLSEGSGSVVIYDNHDDKKTGEIDISKLEWKDKGNGFSIELKDSQYRKLGNYNAKLLYTLEETP